MKISRLFVLALFAACGGGSDNPDPDAAVTDAPSGDAAPDPERAVVVAGDFNPGSPGTLVMVDVATKAVLPLTAPAGAIAEDPIVRYEAGELLVVNRNAGNNVTILDAKTLDLVEQLGTGASSNPQDVVALGNKLFVATLGNKGAVVLTRGSQSIQEIDLSADDPDAKPNCSSVFKVANKLFVACGLLDDTMLYLPPRGPGKVYVLDAQTFEKSATLTLSTKNPISLFEQIPENAPNAGDLLLPTVEFATGNGCVERITTSGTPTAAGCLVDNSVLGGYGSRVGVLPASSPMLYAAVPASDFSGSALRAYDLGTNMLKTEQSPAAQTIGDLAVCPTSKTIVVADTKMGSSGVRLYQGTTELTTAPLPIALRPQSTHGVICY
ncbi:MAG: hypothetical protein SFX73_20665 [Kofleriaceae bacterium]|nr:hypothetical protein [Kofleriaceae bacterium]